MARNYNNTYTKEQVWILRENQDALNGQLSSYNRVGGTNAELSVALGLDAPEDVDPNADPNVLILEKLKSLKASVVEKVTLFLQYRLGCTLDFRNSLIEGYIPVHAENDGQMADRTALDLIAHESAKLALPVDLNRYSYLNVFIIGVLKYLNDLEYIRRVSTKQMVPLPQFRHNKYNHLRYKFHRYKVQFMMASKHEAMKEFNSLRNVGWELINRKFEGVNEKSLEFITKFNRISSANLSPETIAEQEYMLHHEYKENLHTQLLNYLQAFGVTATPIPCQSTSRDTTRLVPEEFPATWTGIAPGNSPVQTESENSMFLNERDSGDEVFTPHLRGDMPQSPGSCSIASSSGDSDSDSGEVPGYDFLSDPFDHKWMDEPAAKYPRRGE